MSVLFGIFGSVIDLVHVEALLLLPRNQAIRWRFMALYKAYSLAYFNHSDPYSDDEDPRKVDQHPNVVAARRPINGIEAMLTNGNYQNELASYRRALEADDRLEMIRLENACCLR